MLWALIKRNIKLFFKDKGMFFTSLITPMILLVLYATFLKNVYESSFMSSLQAFGATVSDKLIDGMVGGQLVSSLLAVSCVTVSFCSNFLMVNDKVTGARGDLTITPVKKSTLALSYYVATLLATLMICFVAAAVCFMYLANVGWYLSAGDVLLLFLDIFLLTMFGTALSSIINVFLTSQGQISAVGAIITAGYGFLCGAYMPISQFSEGLQNVLAFFPGTHGTSLLRNHMLRGVYEEMDAVGFPNEVIESIKDSVDCNIYFFDNKIDMTVMYAVLIGTVVALVAAYVVFNMMNKGKKRK